LLLPFDESAGFAAPPAFGTFRVLHQIGSGVLGPVFRTYDPQRDRLVAVKAFRLDIVPEQVAKLAESLRRLASAPLKHPGLVPMLEAGLEGTTAYLASDYITVETLDVALRHLAPAPLERVEPMLAQIALAIDAAWAAGVGHGALHPRDVFVTVETNEAALSGFGVLQALESVGVKTPVRRPYAAPERIAGDAWTIRADVYSLGAMAHELLTRRRPAGPGEQDGALTSGTSAEQRVLIRRVLSVALAERPEDRFPSARAFTDALGAIVREQPIGSLPQIPPAQVAAVEAEESPARPATETAAEAARSVELNFPLTDDAAQEPAEPEAPIAVAREAIPASLFELMPAAEPAPEPTAKPAATDAGPVQTTDSEAAPEDPPVRPAAPEVPSPESEPLWRSPPEARVAPMFHDVVSPGSPSFPWSAVAAVGVACLALGLVIGYQWGHRTPAAVPPAAAVAGLKPADTTEVPVPQEPAARASQPGRSAAVPAPREPTPTRDTKPAPPKPATGPGRIVIRSTPSGAMVLVDGRPRGQTPATVKDLALGNHTIDVARPGYVPHSERVTLSARNAVRAMTITLVAGKGDGVTGSSPAASASALGSIYVDSRPRGARVMIDGRVIGTTPLLVPELRPGDHNVELELAGFRPFTTKVALKASEQAKVTAALQERDRN
jgi:serine/threonine-protein kinase